MTETITVEHRVHNEAVLKALDRMTKGFERLAKESERTTQTTRRGAKAAAGSFDELNNELKESVRQLRKMKTGTREFELQKQKVDRLTRALKKKKEELHGSTAEMGRLGGMTASVGLKVASLAGGIGGVTAAINTMRAAIENVEQGNERKRLATVEFEEGLAEGKGNFVAQSDKDRLRKTSLDIAEAEGLNPGGVAAALGNLKSRGAADLDEAAEFLREAAGVSTGNIVNAEALALAGLVEKRGIGKGSAKEILGGILSAQVASQTSNPTEFGSSFSANTVAMVQSGGFTPEEAREEGAIFSVLEPKSPDIAATSERAFTNQVRKFAPEKSQTVTQDDLAEFESAQTIRDRIVVLEGNTALRHQLFSKLQDTGRDAIVRRLEPSEADSATFAQIRRDTVSGAEAAKRFEERQRQTELDAPHLLAERRRESQAKAADIRAKSLAKFEADVHASNNTVIERAYDDTEADWFTRKLHGFGTYLEAAASDDTLAKVRMNQLAFVANDDPQKNDRELAMQQLRSLQNVAYAEGLNEQAEQLRTLIATAEKTNALLEQQIAQNNANQAAPEPLPPVNQPVPAAGLGD